MVVDFSDYCGSDRVEFVRSDGRWRWVSGPFVSAHTIAARIFSYRENPSRAEMEWMGDYVLSVGKLIDVAYEAMRVERRSRYEDREEAYRRSVQRSKQMGLYTQAFPVLEKTFIYLMRHSNGLIKIGRSKSPRTREKTLQAEDPKLELIFHSEADVGVEKRLHAIFHSLRVRGEWFELMPHHVEWIVLVLSNQRMES